MEYGLKIIGASVVLIIGFWIIKGITRATRNIMEKRDIDRSLRPFLVSLISILLKIMLIISVMTMVGIAMTSFIALLGAAGLAIGMALSGTLQNFAGGVIILLFKPFKVGDFIEAQGYNGTVSEIQIFNTLLKSPDNKTIIIPNGGLSTGSLINFTTEPTRRVDFVFSVGYPDDIDKAKAVIMDVIKTEPEIHQTPEPFVAVTALADSSVNLVVRVWTDTSSYWNIYFSLTEKVKKAFDKEGISIPFPQQDVHIFQQK